MAYEIKPSVLNTPARAVGVPAATGETPTSNGDVPPPSGAAARGLAADHADVKAAPGTAPTTAELVARAKAEGAMPQEAVEPSPASDGEFKTFGHSGKITLSLIQKLPIWADDRTPITAEQWAEMPQAQRDEILAKLPLDSTRAVHLHNMDPEVAKAKAALKQLAKSAYKGFFNYLEKHAAPPESTPKP